MSHRFSHGCQNSNIQKSSSSMTVSQRQKLSCAWCNSKGAMMEHPPCEIIQQQSQRYSHQSNAGAERMVQTIRNQIRAYEIQIEKNSGITITADSPLLTWLPRHAAWQYTRFHKRQDSTTTAYEKIRHMSYQSPILLVGEAVACRRPGALVNKLESAWLEGIWLGRDSKTDEHLIGTPNGMVRSRALKRRVERRRWDTTLLNAMIWDPWKPTPVTRGRPLKVRSDREPILMGPIPRLQVNPPDDADTVATPNLETTSGTTTQSVAERTRVRLPEQSQEAEGAPPVQKTRTTPTDPVTTTAETMATTTPTARALVERVGDEAGEDSQPVQMRRIAALMAECEDACTSEAIVEARRIHLEKLTKVKDAVIKVVPRTDATTKPLTGRWVDTMHDDGARKARWTTRGYEQTLNGNEDFFSATPAMMHLKMMLVEAALKGHVAAIGDSSGGLLPVTFEPRWNGKPSLDRTASRGRAGTRLHLGSHVSFPRSQGSTKGLGHLQRESSHEFHATETVTVRLLLVLSFRTKSRTHRRESRKTHR